MPTFSEVAQRYVDDVLSGRVIAGGLLKKALQRDVDDLARVDDPAYPYRFDESAGERVCRFVQTLPHTRGEWARRREHMKLEPWQVFLVMALFGWLRKSNGKRRFREGYLEVARKNGKSQLAAALGLYMLLADREHGPEVCAGATTEHQARVVFTEAKRMLSKSPALIERTGAQVLADELLGGEAGGSFVVLARKPGDGASPSFAIVDEYHEHGTSELLDAMQTGMGAREQALTLITTTAGSSAGGPCFDKRDEVIKMLDRVIPNDELLGLIYSADTEDAWTDPKILPKANPNIEVSISADFLLAQQRQAVGSTLNQFRFQTKHLCRWVSVRSGWMDMGLWNKCALAPKDESEMLELKAEAFEWSCVFAEDFARKTDFCTEQRLYRGVQKRGDKPLFFLYGTYWLPEGTIDEPGPNQALYRKWVSEDHLIATDGFSIDFELITETIIANCKRVNPQEVVYDPHIATQVAQELMAEGINAVEFVQNPSAFGVPMDELTSALKDGRFLHDGNPITAWCMSNVVARPVKKGLFAPMKAKDHLKIDGAVAAIMAMGRAALQSEAKPEPKYFYGFVSA